MRDVARYQAHLDKVSRSFAFCIAKLLMPFRGWVALSYLLCRVLDTVEDSRWPDLARRELQFSELERFLVQRPSVASVEAWGARFPEEIPEGEKLLVRDAFFLFDDLHEVPEGVRRAIQETVGRMAAGMRHFVGRGEMRLEDLKDVNRYCYFVAGVVGELLTKLYLEYRPDFRPKPSFYKDAFHFGLFLQKVNLLKDQRRDEAEGRYLVPDRVELTASLREHAIRSVEYVAALPADEKAYRTFCAWSLFLGAASLPWMQEAYAKNDDSKIPRQVTQELLEIVEGMCQDDEALRERLQEFLPLLPEMPITPVRESRAEWFHRIRGTFLGPEALSEIGVM